MSMRTGNDTQPPVSAAGVFDWLLDNTDLTPIWWSMPVTFSAWWHHRVLVLGGMSRVVLNIAPPGRGPVPHGQ